MIQSLHAAPQHASRVTEWLWQAFGGETLPQAFFASIVEHSQTPGALPITFVAVEGERLLGTVGLWRCDLISRQDLYPWMAALYVAPEARGQGLGRALLLHTFQVFKQRGEAFVDLKVLESNLRARHLYERAGMVFVLRDLVPED